ncbi:MAG: class I SAM-dependent methyltransferase [candidate division WS1 bacterium]|nr:class I SAM-dependent methyltransferase [candidate division WS1 bacterium]
MRSAEAENRAYFREAYLNGEHGWGVTEPDPFVVKYLARLRELAPGGRLLDLGCGEGRHAIAGAGLGFRVTGVDFEPGALQRARKAARAEGVRVTFRQADVRALPFPAGAFDAVLDYGCLHHQRQADWPAYRASLCQVLKPGGYYLLSVFSPRFRLFAGSQRSWHIAHGAYRRCFTLEELVSMFKSDFEILELVEERPKGLWHALMRRRCAR